MSWSVAPAHGAEADPIAARIDWQGSVCGDAAGFSSRILDRTQHVRFVTAGEQLRLDVRIQQQGAALRANVTFRAPGKSPVVRKLESPDCDDALDALALVVAIGVDERWRELSTARARPAPPARARARQRPRERSPEPAALPPEPALDPGVASVTVPPTTLAVRAPAPAPEARASVPPVTPARAPEPATPAWTWAGGASAQLVEGAAPEPLLGGELWLRASWERNSVWSPEFGASLAHDRASGIERAEGDADFALSAAGLELCPLRLGTARLRLQPCLAATFGWLEASGRRTFRAHTEVSPWLTLGGGVQGMATVGRLALRVAAGGAHPFQREGYRFHALDCTASDCGDPVFHRVAPVVWSVGVGAGLGF